MWLCLKLESLLLILYYITRVILSAIGLGGILVITH